MNKFFEIDLPKWPAIRVIGKSVTTDQAKDIIFKCDDFLTDCWGYSGGNNQDFKKWYRELAGLDLVKEIDEEAEDKFFESLGVLSPKLEYLGIDLASSCYVGGPTGWCNVDGTIALESKNVGKWPSVAEVFAEWKMIAEAFPFLDLTCTLYSGEYCEENIKPIVTYVVKDGAVTIEEPAAEEPVIFKDVDFNFINRKEQGLPQDWCEEFAKRVKSVVDTIKK